MKSVVVLLVLQDVLLLAVLNQQALTLQVQKTQLEVSLDNRDMKQKFSTQKSPEVFPRLIL
jgi:hypothetical protein